MRFMLNNQEVDAQPLTPDTTLLNYLREQQGLTGTKEGCASGDCGACTVIIGKEVNGSTQYQAVNSCIYPVESLSNQHVITIDKLHELTANNSLSPVQQEMVSCHGSQCGFCTPGFIMSLTALHLQHQDGVPESDTSTQAIDAVSGNLCRCTGYRPILEAANNALKKPNQLTNFVQIPKKRADQQALLPSHNLSTFFARPTNEQQLQQWLGQYPKAKLIAGGTDLMLTVTQGYTPLEQLIDLTHVQSLQNIDEHSERFEIGAAVSYSQLEDWAKTHSPVLHKQLLHRLGSRQIRNRGTIGGNICNASPIGDMPPYLLVLNARVELTSSAGTVRSMPIQAFFLDYKQTSLKDDEYLSRIIIDKAALAQPLQIFKLSKRFEDDISSILGVFTLAAGQLNIAFGGMAAIPVRASKTEAFLANHPWHDSQGYSAEVLNQACEILVEEFSPISDVRASADYRRLASANLLKKACWSMQTQQHPELAMGVFDHA